MSTNGPRRINVTQQDKKKNSIFLTNIKTSNKKWKQMNEWKPKGLTTTTKQQDKVFIIMKHIGVKTNLSQHTNNLQEISSPHLVFSFNFEKNLSVKTATSI